MFGRLNITCDIQTEWLHLSVLTHYVLYRCSIS